MYTEEQKKAISQEFKANILGDSEMRKTAGLAATEFFRTEIRENAIYRQIIPPTAVTADDFDLQEDTDFPVMIVEIAPLCRGAYQVPFETNPKNNVIHGRKARVEFNRIMSDRLEIDKIRLEGYKMDILDELYDLMLKNIMDVEDGSYTKLNQKIVGFDETTSVMNTNNAASNPTGGYDMFGTYGCRRAINAGALDRDAIPLIKQGILYAPGNIKPAKQMMSEIFYSEFFKLDRTEVGGDMAQDIFVNGFTQTKVNGVDTLVTAKSEVCGVNDVWCFADPKYYAGFYTYKDVSMVIDEKDDIWHTFFAHETIGGIVVNRAGVSLTRFDASATETGWKA